MINGKEISCIRAIGSRFNGNCVDVRIGDKHYRLPCEVIQKMVVHFDFKAELKRIHTHLTEPTLIS